MSVFHDTRSVALRRISIPVRSESPAASRTTIAIVSYDTELASACARVLTNAGYSVRTAVHSGHVLLACLQGERIDVLISEMSMEEGSGPSLTRRLRRHNPDLRAIYIAKAGTLCEAENVVVRPFTQDDLLSALSRQLCA